MARRVKYLIDTENVGSSWTELLPFLGKNDEILLLSLIHIWPLPK